MQKNCTYLFSESPVLTAVLRLAVPTVIGQIILVIYNISDTFFVGLTGSDAKLAAVTVCMPAFMLLSAISNLFGIGGAAVFSRALGRKEEERARQASAFAFWGCLMTGFLYSLLVLAFLHPITDLLGGMHEEVHRYAAEYLLVTVAAGGVFTCMNNFLAHMIRAEGHALIASTGIALGGVLNILLDPLFMFRILPPGMETLGAAVATALSNVAACAYFALAAAVLRGRSSGLAFRWRASLLCGDVPREVLMTGLPACLMTVCENVSYAVLDRLMALEGLAVQAGIGVAKKINMLAHSVVRGMCQGVLPLLAYNYGAGRFRRMRSAFAISTCISVAVSMGFMLVCLLFARPMVNIFLADNGESSLWGTVFLHILCTGCPLSAFAYAVISFFQAVGADKRSFCLAVMRKGALDIPLMLALRRLYPVSGPVIATPAADFLCCMAAAVLLHHFLKDIQRPEGNVPLIVHGWESE